MGLKTLSRHTISEVFDYIDAAPKHGQRINFHGHNIYIRKARLLNFRKHGIQCVICKRKGAFFVKEIEEKNKEAPHLNLYGFNKQGGRLLFTKDHIRPVSKGGPNSLFNYQVMCAECNVKKDNTWSMKDRLLYRYRKILYRLGLYNNERV